MRAITQIAATSVVRQDGVRDTFLFALADDGSVWAMEDPELETPTRKWRQVPHLPQTAAVLPVGGR